MGKAKQPSFTQEANSSNNEDLPPAYEEASASTSTNGKRVATNEPLPSDSETSAATTESVTPTRAVPLHSSDKATKSRFLRMVYLTLVVEGCIISFIIAGCIFCPPVRKSFNEVSSFKFWLYWIIALSLSSAIGGLNACARLDPMNLFLASAITVASGGLLGSLSAYFDTIKILLSVGNIVAACGCLVIYSLIPTFQLTPKFTQKFLLTPKITLGLSFILTAIGYGFLCICYTPKESMWISAGPLTFLLYCCIVSQLVIKDARELHVERRLKSNEILYGTTLIEMAVVNVVNDLLVKCIPCCRPCAQCSDYCPKV